MIDTVKRKGAGRPKGSPNKNRMPKTTALMKTSLQGLEMGIEHFRKILLDEKSSEKQKELAATRLMEIGYKFLTSVDPEDAKRKYEEAGVDNESTEEVQKEDKKEPAGFTLLNFSNQTK